MDFKSFLEKLGQLLVEEVLKQPYFIIGLMVVVGYIVLKKKWYEVLSGFIRAVVGYMILQVGSGGLSSAATPFIDGLKSLSGNLDKVVLLDTYTTQSTIESLVGNLVSSVYIILLVAFVLNIVLVALKKYTKLRAIFTTGHVQMQQAFLAFFLLAWAYGIAFDHGANGVAPVMPELPWYLFVACGAALGLYWAVGGNLTLKPAQELTDGAGFAVAHQQMFSVALIDILGTRAQRKGKKITKLEDLEFPGWLNIFNDSMVATTFIMAVFFGVISVIVAIANPDYWPAAMPVLDKISGYQQNVVFFVFKQICQFAVYLAILQLGVRTFVTELSNAFQGISQKLLPGAVPAVDCAVAYGFGSQNAVTLGFIAGAVGQVVGVAILVVSSGLGLGILCITMFVPIFFDNATIGVFANAKLGIKGTIIFPLINGLLQVILSALLASIVGLDTGVWSANKDGVWSQGQGAWMAMNDWITVWPLFAFIVKFIPYVGIFIVVAILLAIPQLQYYLSHKKEDREDYFLQVTDWEAYKAKHITPYLEVKPEEAVA
ncbi:MAG: PTS ascorbate transporter subunit IIC [Acholeplasmatales bacterium]|jgi:PTS system ascorbate-specific IIC component|nr:PTS ascorbate transporter subunit IIC [Acholeplasmatales bacterium]